jgi:hypothetical protein
MCSAAVQAKVVPDTIRDMSTAAADRIVSSINAAALAGELSLADFRRIQEAMGRVFSLVQNDAKRELAVNMPVTFKDKAGITQAGTVKRILKKNVEVFVPATNTTWRLTPTLVQAA